MRALLLVLATDGLKPDHVLVVIRLLSEAMHSVSNRDAFAEEVRAR